MGASGEKERSRLPKILIVGGGFGGLTCAQSLAGAPVDVLLVDRTNHHLFQPLLYQVAMAGLSPAEIAGPIRSILAEQKNARVLLAEATAIDLKARRVQLKDESYVDYDFLVLATGAETSYFGHDDWQKYASGLKSIDDAIEVRQRVLLAFERAERLNDPEEQKKLLSFVVIGGGPTGVELAGALAELSRFVLASDFRRISSRSATVSLLEAGERVLSSFPEDLSQRALEQLNELGVIVRTGARVTRIDESGVELGNERLPASVVLWGAGVKATDLTKGLGTKLDKSGRILVERDLTIPGYENAFAIGDMCSFTHQTGSPLPGVSPVAMQQARTVAKTIRRRLNGKDAVPFHYVDKGSMATIGRSRAIAQVGRIHMSGFVAWLAWLFVHIWYLIGFRSRIVVLFTWFWSYITYRRGARLITGYGSHVPHPAHAVITGPVDGVRPSERVLAPRVEHRGSAD